MQSPSCRLKIYIDAGNFFESASERLSVLCRNPTYNDKAFAVLQCFGADFSIKIKLFKLRKVFTDSNLIFVNIIVNPLLSFFKLFLKMGNKALKFFQMNSRCVINSENITFSKYNPEKILSISSVLSIGAK